MFRIIGFDPDLAIDCRTFTGLLRSKFFLHRFFTAYGKDPQIQTEAAINFSCDLGHVEYL